MVCLSLLVPFLLIFCLYFFFFFCHADVTACETASGQDVDEPERSTAMSSHSPCAVLIESMEIFFIINSSYLLVNNFMFYTCFYNFPRLHKRRSPSGAEKCTGSKTPGCRYLEIFFCQCFIIFLPAQS